MTMIKVSQVGDIPIFVSDQGKFFAEVDGKPISRASLRPLERLIAETLNPVPVIIPKRVWDWHIAKDNIIRAAGRRLKGEQASYDYYSDAVFLYDAQALAKLAELLAQHKKLCSQWDAVLNEMTRVTAENLDSLRPTEEP